jgi:hypothetical protein
LRGRKGLRRGLCSIIFNDEFSYRNFCDLELDILSIGMDVMV